jgi:hypothetical protein
MHGYTRVAVFLMATEFITPIGAAGQAHSAAIALPAVIQECERSLLRFCSTWTLNGGQYTASWPDGARATLTVSRFDDHAIALHRVDTGDSKNAGMTAEYVGEVDGGRMKGKVTYTWPGHTPPVGFGTWDATFTPAAPQAAPATAPTTAPSAAPTGRENAGARPAAQASTGDDCALPMAPANWTSDSYKRSAGQMWKLNGDMLSYTDMLEHKPVSFRVRRPAFWLRWKACAAPSSVAQQGDAGYWIWVSDDRRDARIFYMTSSSDHFMLVVRLPPVNVVLDEEAQAR